jgi:hypothetical protein
MVLNVGNMYFTTMITPVASESADTKLNLTCFVSIKSFSLPNIKPSKTISKITKATNTLSVFLWFTITFFLDSSIDKNFNIENN